MTEQERREVVNSIEDMYHANVTTQIHRIKLLQQGPLELLHKLALCSAAYTALLQATEANVELPAYIIARCNLQDD